MHLGGTCVTSNDTQTRVTWLPTKKVVRDVNGMGGALKAYVCNVVCNVSDIHKAPTRYSFTQVRVMKFTFHW